MKIPSIKVFVPTSQSPRQIALLNQAAAELAKTAEQIQANLGVTVFIVEDANLGQSSSLDTADGSFNVLDDRSAMVRGYEMECAHLNTDDPHFLRRPSLAG